MKIVIKGSCTNFTETNFTLRDLLFGDEGEDINFDDSWEKTWIKSDNYHGSTNKNGDFISILEDISIRRGTDIIKEPSLDKILFYIKDGYKLINVGTSIAPSFISSVKIEEIVFEDKRGKFVLDDSYFEKEYLFISQ